MQMSNRIVNLPMTQFRPEISAAAQREMQSFYRDQYHKPCRSITSLALHDGNEVFGVGSIESSAPYLLGSEASASEAVARLQTLIALLSCLR